MTQEELNAFDRYMDELPDIMEREEDTADAPDGIFPDGRYYDWDEHLKAVVETAPDGRRYIVKYQNGAVARLRELSVAACAD